MENFLNQDIPIQMNDYKGSDPSQLNLSSTKQNWRDIEVHKR